MKVFRMITLMLICLICTVPADSFANQEESFESLVVKSDSLWIKKSYTLLLPVLEEMLELSVSDNDARRNIESLVSLHEYMAFCIVDNDKAIEYLTNAIDLADQSGLDSLRLMTRSRQIYFHQSTSRDEELVSEILEEMRVINSSLRSEFYTFAINQWAAQISGNKRFIKIQVPEEEIKRALFSIRESINYFTTEDQENLFFYQQVRRVIIAFYNSSFDYEDCVKYNQELKDVAPLMKDPSSEMGNLIYEGIFLLGFKKPLDLIERYKEEKKLLETANEGVVKFYYEIIAIAYRAIGDFENALLATERKHFYASKVNNVAFANKVDAVRLANRALVSQKENDSLSQRNIFMVIIAGLLLTALMSALYSRLQLKRKSKVIQDQKEELINIGLSKNKLFGILAHDLKEPITSFSNLSKKVNFLVKKKDWDRLDEMTNQLESKTSGLASMLDNILPWMSTQMKNPVQNLSETLLNPIVQSVMVELAYKLKEKNVVVQDEVSQGLVALVNVDALQIVLRNIFTNAIKYSEQGGEIRIYSHANKNRVSIVIQDFGKGIPANQLEYVFSDYKSTVGTNGEIGNGLGLKLSKDLMISMNGNIDLKSVESKGTSVEIIVPKVVNS